MTTTVTNVEVLRSVRTLLAESINYAGLFPPSAVSMADAVINYATYRNSNYSWMLGRFVVTAARLDEFYESASDFVSRDADSEWHLSVVAGEDIGDTIRRIEQFTAASHGVIIDSVEVRANTTSKIKNTDRAASQRRHRVFRTATRRRAGRPDRRRQPRWRAAKIRTGGVTPHAFRLRRTSFDLFAGVSRQMFGSRRPQVCIIRYGVSNRSHMRRIRFRARCTVF